MCTLLVWTCDSFLVSRCLAVGLPCPMKTLLRGMRNCHTPEMGFSTWTRGMVRFFVFLCLFLDLYWLLLFDLSLQLSHSVSRERNQFQFVFS